MRSVTLTIKGDCESEFIEWLQQVSNLLNSGSGVGLYANPKDENLFVHLDGDGVDTLDIKILKSLKPFNEGLTFNRLKR